MGGKGKKRAKNKQHQQSGQHKGRHKSHAESVSSETVVSKGRSGKNLPVPGLSNLGNTCFFNSVIQNLGQSRYFRTELSNLLAKPSYTVEIKLPGREDSYSRQLCVNDEVGPLAKALSSFLSQMQTGGIVLNPRPVFSEISKKASRFSGYHQQDSQELLRCLLDILRAEEIKRIKRTILTSYNVSGTKSEHLTDSDRADIKAYGLQAHFLNTFVDRAFGGVLTSTVVCKECMNKSSMHETFLDLSLPIGDDKNMSTSHTSTDHQTRSKGKKKGEPSLPKAHPELSKYQLKKQEKQARKAARSANKKSLQKFLNDVNPSSPTTAPENPEVANEIEPVSNEGDQDTNEDLKTAEVENPSVAETGSSNLEISTADPGPNIDGDYAAEGPLPDTGTIQDTNSVHVPLPDTGTIQDTNSVPDASNVQDTSTEVEQEEAINIECNTEEVMDQQPEPIETAQFKPNTELAQAALPESLVQPFESLKVQPDSLEASLKKFCTPELLTDANKFACVVCTKLRYESQSNVNTELPTIDDKAVSESTPSVSNSEENTIEKDNVLNDVLGTEVATVIVNEPEEQEIADSRGSVVSENNSSVTDSHDNTSQQDDSSGEADNEESSEDEPAAPAPKPPTSIAFCEATKQILIEKAPLILTLHLKRFVQHGRRLQKNNKYVSFPPLLDMTPFCTQTKKDPGNEQLLYSLYGIVEHSGSMQGGHYVAYIKQRSPPKSPPTNTKDNLITDQTLPTDSTKDTNTDNDNPLTKVESGESETISTSEACAVDPKNFDLSCTLGQWYYVSDSHVRTATENEVMKSQAYLLFYDKIPQM